MNLHDLRRRTQQKRSKSGRLNLVSLMDIFTILVFFLMVNSSEVEVLQTSSKIKLPDSTSEQKPETELVILVDDKNLVIQGRPVASIADLAQMDQLIIPGLQNELRYLAERRGEVPDSGHEITVMGDRELPYWLLKRILTTCQSTEFSNVALAVNKVAGAEPEVASAEDLAVTAS